MSERRARPGCAQERPRGFVRRAWVAGWVALGLAVALVGPASGQRSEDGFPLTFDRTVVDLGDEVRPGVEVAVVFVLTNPTDETVEYFSKVSSRSVTAPWKTTEIGPGEAREVEVRIKPKIAGPFRYRIGFVAGETRAAVFIQGWASE